MPILEGDIKMFASDTMDDSAQGGGAVTGNIVVDATSNNIFDDISTLDTVYGAVHMRKVFNAVFTQNKDKFYGSHVIISKLPKNKKIGVNLFNTQDWFDRRPSAASRVENYLAKGGKYPGMLWATQYAGSKVVTIFQREDAPKVGVGDVIVLKSSSDEQYVRITSYNESLQSFTDSDGVYTRLIVNLNISDSLQVDFVGTPMSRYDNVTPPTEVINTVVANAARYYSANELSQPASLGDIQVKVDSVYSQVVPSARAENSIVDANASGTLAPIINSSSLPFSIVFSDTLSASSRVYAGNSILPGSISFSVSGDTLTDDGGQLKNGANTVVASVSYSDGLITFTDTAPTYTGTKTLTFTTASAPVRLANTDSIPVTISSRGYIYTININPAPAPTSVRVSYMALGKWYELSDDGGGKLSGAVSGIGSGTVNYVSGSVSVTLGALPDVDTEIIFSWGESFEYIDRSSLIAPTYRITEQLPDTGIQPDTLTIAWNDGAAKLITGQADGSLTGDVVAGAGSYVDSATGFLDFVPSSAPLKGQQMTVSYSSGPATVKTISPVSVAGQVMSFNLGDINIKNGSVTVSFDANWVADPLFHSWQIIQAGGTVKIVLRDNSIGGFVDATGATIDYATGQVSIDLSIFSHDYPYRYYDVYAMRVGMATAQLIPPTAINATYRLGTANTKPNVIITVNSLDFDLTPGYAEPIVQGSLLADYGQKRYIDRQGDLYVDIDPVTGSGTFAGTIDYSTGKVNITNWIGGFAGGKMYSLLTTVNFHVVNEVVFRVAIAPVQPGSFSIRAVPHIAGGQISATADSSGNILTAEMTGFIDYKTGIVKIRFGALVVAAGNESEYWYDAANVDTSGDIFKPLDVFADTIFYNAVSYSYLPLSSTILGLNPVRLPSDGRVPVYAPGDVVVVLNDQETVGTFSNSTTTNLGRVRLAKLSVRDSAGNLIPDAAYTADLDLGTITWVNVTGLSQPLTITDRIEDMAVLTDVQITGELSLSSTLTHDFPTTGTLVSNAVIYGDLFAHATIPFDQQTWTGEWSDSIIGASTLAQYNNNLNPIILDNASCIQERWVFIFTSATAFNCIGEHVGQIGSGTKGTDFSPINPNTNFPYFTVQSAGWGSGWSAGNVLRFNTLAANVPTWVIQAISQGQATDPDYTFCLEFRGDIDTTP